MTNTEKSVKFAEPEKIPVVGKLGYDIVVNILMLGDEEVGKASVVRRYTEGYFPVNENLYNLNVESKTRNIIGWGGTGYNGSKPVVARLQIWNFHMHKINDGPMIQHYLDSNGFLLFFDVTSKTSFLQLPILIEMVKSKYKSNQQQQQQQNHHEKESIQQEDQQPNPLNTPPIVIVGNKCDDVDNTVVDQVAAKKYCDSLNMPLFFISAKTGENIELAFNTLQSLIVKQNKAKEREKIKQLKLQKIEQHKNLKTKVETTRSSKKVTKEAVPCSLM